jgi:hypothetical protein
VLIELVISDSNSTRTNAEIARATATDAQRSFRRASDFLAKPVCCDDAQLITYLVTHGAKDRQIPLQYAHQSYDEAINRPRRELKLFTDREGGVGHVSADNMEPVCSHLQA